MYVCRPLNYTDFVIITTSSDLDYRQLEEKKRWFFFFGCLATMGKHNVCVYNLMINGAFRKLGDKYVHMHSISIACVSATSESGSF